MPKKIERNTYNMSLNRKNIELTLIATEANHFRPQQNVGFSSIKGDSMI